MTGRFGFFHRHVLGILVKAEAFAVEFDAVSIMEKFLPCLENSAVPEPTVALD